MNDMTGPLAMEDAAWASIQTPLSVVELHQFCADIERLFRINPMLEFKKWENKGAGAYLISALNSSQETSFEFETEFTVSKLDDGLQISYNSGIKSSTEIKIEACDSGSKLTITDRYDRLPVDEREQHLAEVDKSITTWAEYIQRYLLMWQRWSGFGLWRWYMRRIWQPMKPSGRRITYMLLWISVVEVALILLGVGIYFAEYA